MGILKPAQNTMAYLKAGIYGDTGSGKTFTAAVIAIGLHKFIGSKKPVAFFDTETGSNYLVEKFKEAGIEFLQARSTSLKDACATFDEAEQTCDIMILDSVTHIWREFTSAYQKKNNRKFIQLWDWKPIKDEWFNSFTSRYNNTKLHIIMCGRAGSIYEDQEDAQNTGKTKSVKVGTKMNSETETGYEPGLLLEMSKCYNGVKGESGEYIRQCHVIKDRFDIIDSAEFDNPKFEDFLPHIKALNLGGDHMGINTVSNSEEMIDDKGDGKYYRNKKKKEICLEEISEEIKKYLPGSSSQEKSFRGDIFEYFFTTRSWKAIEAKDPLELEIILRGLKHILSQYKGEKTFKEFIDKADKKVPEKEQEQPDRYMCPNANKYVTSVECGSCESRKGCPEHADDIDV
jgi:hypothetical protein